MNENKSTADGVTHGPYPRMPEDMVDVYQARYAEGMNNEIDLEQFMADRESEWQYNQHCEAVSAAELDGRVNEKQAEYLINNLRPYWVGYRHSGE